MKRSSMKRTEKMMYHNQAPALIAIVVEVAHRMTLYEMKRATFHY